LYPEARIVKRCVSYSLFSHPDGGSWKSDGTPGKIDGYIRYLPAIIRAHHALWPGWDLVLHHDDAVRRHKYFGVLERMQTSGLIELVDCKHCFEVGYGPMWRFMPAFRGDDRIVLCHDIDSFPMVLTRLIAEEFALECEEDRPHAAAVIHGCESHNTAMAGLFLLRSSLFRFHTGASTFVDFMNLGARSSFGTYGTDELYLRDVVWPKVLDRSVLYRTGTDRPSLINSHDVRKGPTRTWSNDADTERLGNSFCPYPGAAGFDVKLVIDMLDRRGTEASRAIRACEDGIMWGTELAS
jgi:hypothetical protein